MSAAGCCVCSVGPPRSPRGQVPSGRGVRRRRRQPLRDLARRDPGFRGPDLTGSTPEFQGCLCSSG
eukprot:8773142-Pyramimonas_sp.AAC.1